MMEFLLQLLGAKTPDVTRIKSAAPALRGSFEPVALLVLLAAMAVLTWWLYRQSPPTLAPWRRRMLTGLRILLISLIIITLMRPVVGLMLEGTMRRELIILVDDSASMQIKDPRVTVDDKKRAAILLGLMPSTNGLNAGPAPSLASPVSRRELMIASLTNASLALLARLEKEYDLLPMAFEKNLRELPRSSSSTNAARQHHGLVSWMDTIQSQGNASAIGDALRDVLTQKRGRPLAGIILITDGANNAGSHPRDAADLLRQENVPLYIHGIGITSPRDIIVSSLFSPDIAFQNDTLPVTVRVRSQGMRGETVRVRLTFDGKTVAEKDIAIGADGDHLVSLPFIPETVGDHEMSAVVDARPDETASNNNNCSKRVRVIATQIKVLLVEQSPRWEFRYLQAMLLRDRRIDLKCLLLDADPSLSRGNDTPYIEKFPAQKEDLYKFDLIILGDVDPRLVSSGTLENLNEWVSRFGGGLVTLAGKKQMPHAWRRTPLERMLPVELDASPVESVPAPLNDRPLRLELTASGRSSPMLRLVDGEEENALLWRDLPPIFWAARVGRAKPAAESLVVDADPARESRSGKMPIVALQHYGLGQVLHIGTDNLWRWRKNTGEMYHTTLWGQMLQRLAMQRLLGASRRNQLTSDRQDYTSGERITVFARLHTTAYEPVQDPVVQGFFAARNERTGRRQSVSLRAIPEQPGLYRGEFTAPSPGQYQFIIESAPDSPLDLNITTPRLEWADTAMNETLLSEIATNTGGAFFREETLWKLPDTIRSKTEKALSPAEIEVWCSPAWFILILTVAASEWFLRKRSQLK